MILLRLAEGLLTGEIIRTEVKIDVVERASDTLV